MKPKCHNRPSLQPGAWMKNAHCPRTGKPRYRWVPAFSIDRCVTWDGVGIGPRTPAWPNGEPYPVAHGWDCRGCRFRLQAMGPHPLGGIKAFESKLPRGFNFIIMSGDRAVINRSDDRRYYVVKGGTPETDAFEPITRNKA